MNIKEKLSITFYPQIKSQTERWNRIIEAYFRAFINHQQNNWARLLSITEFVHNNIKDANMRYTTFELNCRYHLGVFHKKMLTLTPSPKQLMSWLSDLGILWLHAKKTLNIFMNNKNKPTIKKPSLEVMLSTKKFGWIANISN